MPLGPFIWATFAGPLSPEKPEVPLPAYVVTTPAGVTFSTRPNVLSSTYMFPAESNRTAAGLPTLEPVADKPVVPGPPPTTVEIFCALTDTLPKIKQARAHRAKRTEFFIDIAFLRWTLSETLIYFLQNKGQPRFSLRANENKSHPEKNPIVRFRTTVGTKGEASNSTFHWYLPKHTTSA